MPILTTLVQSLLTLPGAMGAAVVDIETGQTIVRQGQIATEVIETAGIINARLLRFKMTVASEQYHQNIEDIIITLSKDYHLLRLVQNSSGTFNRFLYLVLDRKMANLAMCRLKLANMVQQLRASEIDTRLMDAECDDALDGNNFQTRTESTMAGTDRENLSAEEYEDDIPAFMRTDVALKLLGVNLDDCTEDPFNMFHSVK